MAKKKYKYVIEPLTRPSKSVELRYQRSLTNIINMITRLVKEHVLPDLKENKKQISAVEDSAVNDGFISDITSKFAVIQTLLKLGDKEGDRTSAEFVGMVGGAAEASANKALERSGMILSETGTSVIARRGIGEALEAYTAENVGLIKNIGQDYLDKIQRAVLDNYLTGKYIGNGGIVKELQKINGISKNRAKLIARDQSNKIYGTVKRLNAESTGAIGYKWITAQDERVRGNPSGKYPNVKRKDDHYIRNDEYYLWKPMKNPPLAPNGKPFREPVKDSPGMAINCRCIARNVWAFEL